MRHTLTHRLDHTRHLPCPVPAAWETDRGRCAGRRRCSSGRWRWWRMRTWPGPGSPTLHGVDDQLLGGRRRAWMRTARDSCVLMECLLVVEAMPLNPATNALDLMRDSASPPRQEADKPALLQSSRCLPLPRPRLTPATLALLLIPPLMWAGNAVVGRLMQGVVPYRSRSTFCAGCWPC